MDIILATPCAGNMVSREYHNSVITEALLSVDRLQQYKHYNLIPFNVSGYSGLPKDRSIIASEALFLRADKVLFIDADQSWTWPQMKKILDSKKPIIAGVVPLKKYPMPLNFTPMVADRDCFSDTDDSSVHYNNFLRLKAKHGDESEVEVQACGTAFMCIDVKVLLEMAKIDAIQPFHCPNLQSGMDFAFDFFQCGVITGYQHLKPWGESPPKHKIKIPGTEIEKNVGVYFGEDWSFCHLARQAGFPIHINTSVEIAHHGNHEFNIGNELKQKEKENGKPNDRSHVTTKNYKRDGLHPESFG